MDELRMLLGAYIQNNEIILSATASNPRNREKLAKIRLRPIHMKNTLYYQAERFVGTKVFHQNIEPLQIPDFFAEAMEVDFRQLELETAQHKVIVLVSKKGNISIKEKTKYVCADAAVQFTENGTNQTALDSAALQANFAHNREKNYILPQEEPVPFLVALGVQTAQGKVVHAKYDKFRQINRYLEFVRDILPYLPNNGKTLRIVDFGCGKSYLTFALYYYLKVMQNYNISVTGLDLKQDVIEKCQALADKLEYNGLKFLVGDIGSYHGTKKADMVVTLHACDTATDYALAKAVKWNAKVILSVPCCQHELNRQISCAALEPVLQYGIIKERMAALITDALRANLLEEQGYDTQLLEFIDMEHTPKNILIRAVKREEKGSSIRYHKSHNSVVNAQQLEEMLHVKPTLRRLLENAKTD